MTATIHVRFDELTNVLAAIFENAGVCPTSAAVLAANCAACERDGSLSHGIFRIPGYVNSLRSGWVDGHARPIVTQPAEAVFRVDARNGFAQPALAAVRDRAERQAREKGVTLIAIRDSHHFSALWPDVEPAARSGLIALSMVSGLACVAPPGGRIPVYGTNPIAFATPLAGSDPIVFDMATSAMSNGDVRLAALHGESLPPGSGVDREGNPTCDPGAVLNGGALLTFGGYKGASISLMVEILASALTGGRFSFEVDFASHPGAETPKTGQMLLLIDPERAEQGNFGERVQSLISAVQSAGQAHLPSERRYARRAEVEKSGIPLERTKWMDLLVASRRPAI